MLANKEDEIKELMESSSVANREELLWRSTENYKLYTDEKDKYKQLLKELK